MVIWYVPNTMLDITQTNGWTVIGVSCIDNGLKATGLALKKMPNSTNMGVWQLKWYTQYLRLMNIAND